MKEKIILTVISGVLLITYSCDNIWNTCVDGNGSIRTETRALDDFEKIRVEGNFQVDIDTGSVNSLVIEADENLLDLVETSITGTELIIGSRNRVCLNPSDPIEIRVTVPYFTGVYLDGSGYIFSFGTEAGEVEIVLSGSGRIDVGVIHAEDLYVELEGSGIINAAAEALNSEVVLEGSGDIRMAGSTVSSDLNITGSGSIKAGGFDSQVCDAFISGSGVINTSVEDDLNAKIIGSGIIYYTGNPVVHTNISGSGEVIHQ